MNREAIEARLHALVNEAPHQTKDSHKPARPVTPQKTYSKATMAALILGGAMLGALAMGIFRGHSVPRTAVPEAVAEASGTGETSGIDTFLLYVGVGRLRK